MSIVSIISPLRIPVPLDPVLSKTQSSISTGSWISTIQTEKTLDIIVLHNKDMES